jgi:hypothetical protein
MSRIFSASPRAGEPPRCAGRSASDRTDDDGLASRSASACAINCACAKVSPRVLGGTMIRHAVGAVATISFGMHRSPQHRGPWPEPVLLDHREPITVT